MVLEAFGDPDNEFDPDNNSDIEELSFDPDDNSDIEEVDLTNVSEVSEDNGSVEENMPALDLEQKPISLEQAQEKIDAVVNQNIDDEDQDESEDEIVEEPYEEILEGDFIVDDEEFIIEEQKDTMLITEEEVIPESKVIANETDQQNNLFNQLMKLIPEKMKTNPKYLKK